MDVEIWSDYVCPFCCIGKANFEKALASWKADVEVRVNYRSFELDPSAPKNQSQSIYEVLAKKYGRDKAWARQMNANVTNTAAAAGITFNMDKVIPTNSFDAHRMGWLASKNGVQNQWTERMFSAYFTEGLDIADPKVLEKIALELGLRREVVQQVLTTDSYAAEVRQDQDMAREFGIQGVPFFILDGKLAVSGAQPPEAFLGAFKELSEMAR